MASVSSLDKDLRNMRLDKYTPQRANEVKKWIEEVLGERLAADDLLEALKDGTALCKLVNVATGGGLRYKASAMPFVQMENISHFLRACQSPPLSLPAHDCFLTVDLYEAKDPAQVLQCIEAFSRRANAANPARIKTAIGGRKGGGLVSPQGTGTTGSGAGYARVRGFSNASESSNAAASSPSGASTSWAKKGDIGATAPAWNIAQYGWTGGASQGNQGVAFGARRQITSAAPHVPSLAEKERRRKEQAEREEQQRREAEEAARMRRLEIEAEEQRAQAEEQRLWEEKTLQLKEAERQAAAEEKRRWEEEERRWQAEESARIREEKEAEARLEREREEKKKRAAAGDGRLRGQFLSQFRAEREESAASAESKRIEELERQLAEAKKREQQYEQERLDRQSKPPAAEDHTVPVPAPAPLAIRQQKEPTPESDAGDDSFQHSERDYLRKAWSDNNSSQQPATQPSSSDLPPIQPLRPMPATPRTQPSRPDDTTATTTPSTQPRRPLPIPGAKPSPRPLPNPAAYAAASSSSSTSSPSTFSQTPPASTPNRTDRFLSSNPAPRTPLASSHVPSEAAFSSTAEREAEDARRSASQQKTKAGGWASRSLLEREMERERERQREWEEAQQRTRERADRGEVDAAAGSGPGQSWDVNSYGFTGGDNLNKGAQGVYAGRRQLVGPRPLNNK